MKKNIVLIKGGGGTEHDISLISAEYIASKIDRDKFNLHEVLIDKKGKWTSQGLPIDFSLNGEMISGSEKFKVDGAIPCIHGPPGETGEIQSYLNMNKIPYIGCGPEASTLCFNKLATKLILENAGIKTAPFIQVRKNENEQALTDFFKKHQDIFLKATNQGSSVGCYHITKLEELTFHLKEAFSLSPYVIAEKTIKGRELELAVYQDESGWHATLPGEIYCPNEFYTYEEKYSQNSQTKTLVVAPEISEQTSTKMKQIALEIVEVIKLRHLARIDFFLSEDGEVYINEINTFPGHTPISMFPMMMENAGLKYFNFLNYHLSQF
ncbi:MAG: D-alanine--D-alanine ligase [Halobacteriovoraceae bacterium]|nr:D-alanine--D-alanine ligase [Halobacteriovoraceae bacterium]|tara:strand:+ start:530 stop:1501 length:972 start_codon:yes stop_codon:yes gene_type:complete